MARKDGSRRPSVADLERRARGGARALGTAAQVAAGFPLLFLMMWLAAC